MGAVYICLLLTKSCLVVEFGFSLCPFEVRRWPRNQSLDDEGWAQRLINLEIPVLVRSLKSSNVELG